MQKNNENFLYNFTIISKNNKKYYNVFDVPKNEFCNIHSIIDINPQLIKTKENIKIIKKFINLRFISCEYNYWNKFTNCELTNLIAIFIKLSMINIIDYLTYSLITHNTGNFIYQNKMTIFNPSNVDFLNITTDIELLNIINDAECDYVFIPNTIKHLHITLNIIDKYKQSNLPINLQSITITIPEIYKKNSIFKINSIIKSKTKLPFNCKLIIDDKYL